MNEKRIIQEVMGQINLENVKFLFWYGTRPGRDIDLLVVLKGKTEVRLCEPSKSKLDILMVDNNEFIRRLNLLDPVVIDPLITGFVLLGDKEEIGELRSEIILSLSHLGKVSREAIQFLRKESNKRLKIAGNFLNEGNGENRRSFLIEISWALSYRVFADYYGNGLKRDSSDFFLPITFNHLLAVDGQVVLEEVMEELELAKSGRKFDKFQMFGLFKKSQELLEVAK